MSAVTRRQFLAAAGSAAAGPVLANAATNPDFDVLIIGAGAAGISAARRIARSGKTFAVLEASDRWGGRCFTDLKTFGMPYDQGRIGSMRLKPFRSINSLQKLGWRPTKSHPPSACASRCRRIHAFAYPLVWRVSPSWKSSIPNL
jgi:choline dehydrogenase-like flavoprotein